MLKIFFTPEDLIRTTISSAAQPMWETVLSLYRLRETNGGMAFDEWRRAAAANVPPSTRMIADLVPRKGYYADFLTPMPEVASMSAGISELLSTSRRRLRTDVSTLAMARRLPSWTGDLGDGRPEVLRRLGSAVGQYFDDCIASHWPRVRAAVDRQRAKQTELLATGGLEAVFLALHPSARWHYPVLEVAYSVDRELHLRGRGLRLVPSFFCRGTPTTFRDDDFQPALVYPITHEVGWSRSGDAGGSLTALLGPTKARVLEVLGESPCTTSDLARRTGTTLSTTSRQATVMRSAGLITSRRTGKSVLHSLTPQGHALLNGSALPMPGPGSPPDR